LTLALLLVSFFRCGNCHQLPSGGPPLLRVYVRPITYFWPSDFGHYVCSFDPMRHTYVSLTFGFRLIGFFEALTATNQVFLNSGFRSIVFGGCGRNNESGFFVSRFRSGRLFWIGVSSNGLLCVIPACEFDMTMNSKCVIILLCESKYNL